MSQSINLIPQAEVKEQKKEKIVKLSSVVSVLLLIIVAGVSAYYWYLVSQLEGELAEIDSRIAASRKDIDSLKDIEITARTLDAKYQIVDEIFLTRRKYSVLLDELNKRIPQGDVNINSFSISGANNDQINLSGKGNDYLAIARFIDTLSNQNYSEAASGLEALFSDVSLSSVTLDGQDLDVTYAISVRFNEELIK